MTIDQLKCVIHLSFGPERIENVADLSINSSYLFGRNVRSALFSHT